MKKLMTILLTGLMTCNAFASENMPYCHDIKIDEKNDGALQKVVHNFIEKYHCKVESSCLSDIDTNTYSITRTQPTSNPAPTNSACEGVTFTCASSGKDCTVLYIGGTE